MEKKKVKDLILDYLLISLGAVIYTLAWVAFMIPHNISSGGLTGACVILNYGTGFPVAYSYIILNAILLIIGTLVLGKGFGFKTIYAIVLSTILLDIGPKIPWLNPANNPFLDIKETVLIPVIGGLFEAVGINMIFNRGGSTGGTDVIALVINKFWPISPGTVYLWTDLFIIATILLIPGKGLQDMIYGYIMMITFSLAVDYFLLGRKSSVQVLIFSDKYSEIADNINQDLHRGVTALDGVGWYTHDERKVLLVIIRKSQLSDLTKQVKSIDNKAFMTVCPTSSVYGRGFDEMKTGLQRKKKIKKSAI